MSQILKVSAVHDDSEKSAQQIAIICAQLAREGVAFECERVAFECERVGNDWVIKFLGGF